VGRVNDALVAFLYARIGEYEAGIGPEGSFGEDYAETCGQDPEGVHLDAAQARAEAGAKRNIVRRCALVLAAFNDPERGEWPDVTRRERSHAYSTLCDLAAIDAEHPDFRQEWAP
jgi:Family of unknown function (DUF6221)